MIYSIHPDIEKFQLFSIDGKFARKALGEDTMFHFDESPISYSDVWKPMELEFYISGKQKTLPIPDISQHYGRLFLNEKAYAALKDILESCGEFLPVFYAGETGYLFNLLALEDNALNKDLCKKNEWDEIVWIGFNEELVANPVFRIEYDNFFSIFCTEKFHSAYMEAELNGLVFAQYIMNEQAFKNKLKELRCQLRDGAQPDYVTESPTPDVFKNK